MPEEEPAGYLGGHTGPAQDLDDYAEENPYGDPSDEGGYDASDEEEVVGYLEGSEADGEDLPALPPAEAEEEAYSAGDFIEDQPYEDPYASEEDPYATSDYDYEGYEEPAVEDDSHFDQMGHASSEETQDFGYSDDYDDPDQPKTISQQDAEKIIERITKTRPTATDAAPRLSPGPRLTPSRRGFRLGPLFAVLLIMLLTVGLGVVLAKEQVGAWLHEMGFGELATMIGYEPPAVVEVPDGPPPESPRARTTRLMKEAVLKSEALALELPDDAAKPPADTGGETTPPGDGGN
ncbi:MAG: hypothetical protein KDD82_12500 [Planctomycetes bacterium]|nr:hypothetical protein [Planctomycetota bacterium]